MPPCGSPRFAPYVRGVGTLDCFPGFYSVFIVFFASQWASHNWGRKWSFGFGLSFEKAEFI